jgi:hypothetical protein
LSFTEVSFANSHEQTNNVTVDFEDVVSDLSDSIQEFNQIFINAVDEFPHFDRIEFISSFEEKASLEFFSKQNFVFNTKLNWLTISLGSDSIKNHIFISSGKLFLLFHRLKIFI